MLLTDYSTGRAALTKPSLLPTSGNFGVNCIVWVIKRGQLLFDYLDLPASPVLQATALSATPWLSFLLLFAFQVLQELLAASTTRALRVNTAECI